MNIYAKFYRQYWQDNQEMPTSLISYMKINNCYLTHYPEKE